jgi:hypothetical protein
MIGGDIVVIHTATRRTARFEGMRWPAQLPCTLGVGPRSECRLPSTMAPMPEPGDPCPDFSPCLDGTGR